MSMGQIIQWDFMSVVFNRGVIAGCSTEVRGQTFGFNLNLVGDEVLRMMLAHTPHMVPRTPNCADMRPSPLWVSFNPSGQFAVNIFRLFH